MSFYLGYDKKEICMMRFSIILVTLFYCFCTIRESQESLDFQVPQAFQ